MFHWILQYIIILNCSILQTTWAEENTQLVLQLFFWTPVSQIKPWRWESIIYYVYCSRVCSLSFLKDSFLCDRRRRREDRRFWRFWLPTIKESQFFFYNGYWAPEEGVSINNIGLRSINHPPAQGERRLFVLTKRERGVSETWTAYLCSWLYECVKWAGQNADFFQTHPSLSLCPHCLSQTAGLVTRLTG